MRAFKAFNKNMTCTHGSGSYQYKENTIYTEERAQAHEAGFHCASYILDCFNYYPKSADTVICPVEALGDIDEDGNDTKISCTVMKIGRRLTCEKIVCHALLYIQQHPQFHDAKNIHLNRGRDSFFCIVRGKDPIASGTKGTVLGYIVENSKKEITALAVYKVDGKKLKPGRYYNVEGKEVEDAQS